MAEEVPNSPTDEKRESESEDESSSSEEEPEYDSEESESQDPISAEQIVNEEEEEVDDNSPETTIRKFNEVLDSKQYRKREAEEDREYVYYEDLFDFPPDPEKWREEDLKELWADGPVEMVNPGWDPVWADEEEDWEVVTEEINAGRDPPIAPFYLPFRKYYPAIPDNHFDISNPKSVIEELDRIEEFLTWVSYIFPDGSSYEGTVWDDLAHGKGVYVAEQGLVRYEGEWLQNNMEGHGVVEVEIPGREPVPGSKLEAKMRAEGKIISRDFMSPEDREWLEMDIEDSILLARGRYEIPFDENNEWIRQFGKKPEKGRYRYAGQWKHARMHGCGVYEVNERIIYGRFYFGEHLEDSTGCDANVSALHAGIAEVAAAKARMFINKPDGMIREERGPYGDPQHPYFYDEDEVWMAPGFINQFYEVPDYWKTYTREVDQEREMWLNSFYKAPLRIPMPAELEYWWSKDEEPEFVLINKEPEPDPEDPTKLIYTEDPLILHTRSGRLINYVEDEKDGVRLFWQPPLKEGEDVDPEKAEFLPLGYDEFYGRAVQGAKKESKLKGLITAIQNALQPMFDRLEKWAEEKKKSSEMKLKLIEQELEFVEAQICLEEEMKEMDMELERKQKEEEKRSEMELKDVEESSVVSRQDDVNSDDEEEEEEDEESPTSFGSVLQGDAKQDPTKNDKKENKPGKSSFSSISMSFAPCSLTSVVPSNLQESFLAWKKRSRLPATTKLSHHQCQESTMGPSESVNSVTFPLLIGPRASLKVVQQSQRLQKKNGRFSQLHSLARALSGPQASARLKTSPSEGSLSHYGLQMKLKTDLDNILSIHIPIRSSDSCTEVYT
ncbi:MORN (Membrane Occupation and Recognition Nexus) repeat-containing protein [Tasmannia lanceolata]|uniref:MORN (Membrane Occupation and Recognition Nexus) repeat-containing protein n=1 Tax=Tasmannia lanceolata TaxID=3420 RepID=UPI00406285BD